MQKNCVFFIVTIDGINPLATKRTHEYISVIKWEKYLFNFTYENRYYEQEGNWQDSLSGHGLFKNDLMDRNALICVIKVQILEQQFSKRHNKDVFDFYVYLK